MKSVNLRVILAFLLISANLKGQITITTTPAATGDTIELCLQNSSQISFQTNVSGPTDSVIWSLPGASPTRFNGLGPFNANYNSVGTYPSRVRSYNNGNITGTYNFTVVVSDIGPVTFNPNQSTFCLNDPPYQLNSFSPGNGSFSGNGIQGTVFNPRTAGVGNHSITYTVNSGSCTQIISKVFTVRALPNGNLSTNISNIVQFQNENVYTKCFPSNGRFNFYTQDPQNTYSTVLIDYGDGSPLDSTTNFGLSSYKTHTFAPGLYTVTATFINSFGCTKITRIKVFFGSTPAAGLSTYGATQGCIPSGNSGLTYAFGINTYSNNPPGTIYKVTFSNDSVTRVFQHPPPDTIYQTFFNSSCGFTSALNEPNTFSGSLVVVNPCDSAPTNVGAIKISEPPKADFEVKDTCANSILNLKNLTDPGKFQFGNCDTATKYLWSVSPQTGFSYNVSDFGNDFGDRNDVDGWTSGVEEPLITINRPGLYSITQYVGNSTVCDYDSVVRQVCIDSIPKPDFALSSNRVCSGDTVNIYYLQEIVPFCDSTDLTFQILETNGWNLVQGAFSDSSFKVTFNNAGNYSVALKSENSCGASFDTLTLDVVGQPFIQFPADTALCGLTSIDFADTTLPFFVADSSGIPSFNWSVNPATGWTYQGNTDSSSRKPNIAFQAYGSYTISLSYTNGCFIRNRNMVVSVNRAPLLFQIRDTTLCNNSNFSNSFTAQYGVSPLLYSWKEENGPLNSGDSIQLANLTDSTRIQVFVQDQEGCLDSSEFWINIPNPLSSSINVTDTVCYNDSISINLSVTGGIGPYEFEWLGVNKQYLSSDIIANPVIDSLGIPGQYIVKITDSLGCVIYDTLVFFEFPKINVDAGPDETVCLSPNNLSLNLATPTGGTWSGNFVNSSGVFNPLNSGLGSHIVYYNFQDSNGCSYIDSLVVNVINPPQAAFSISDTVGCAPLSISIASSASLALSHEWYLNDSLIGTNRNFSLLLQNNSPTRDRIYELKLKVLSSGVNCVDSMIKTIAVYPQPSALFNLPDSLCATDTVQLIQSSVYKGSVLDSLRWLTSSSSLTVDDPTVSPTSLILPDNQSGTDSSYTVSLIVYTQDGCSDTLSRVVTVRSRPRALFGLPASGCGPMLLQPQDSSMGPGLSYSWSINPLVSGTGLNSSTPDFSLPVSMSDSVTYRISLTLVDDRGCMDTLTRTFTLYPKPTAGFTMSNQDSCGPLSVSFTNVSLSGQTGMDSSSMSFSWDFGQGSGSVLSSPAAVTYVNPGLLDTTYYVRLIATNAFGCSDTLTDSLVVRADPVANYSSIVYTDCAPFQIDTTIISWQDYSSANSAYLWQVLNTKDSILASGTNPDQINYLINSPADTVKVRLIALSPSGCANDSLERVFQTIPNPRPDFQILNPGGCSPHTLSIVDSSSSGVSYQWYVNNQLVSTNQIPNITLTNTSKTLDSLFTIKLIVTASLSGCSDSLERLVDVYALPDPSFIASPVCEGDSVDFIDQSFSVDSITSWYWDYGDGITDSIQSPKHLFSGYGWQNVSLTVTDSRNCSFTFNDSVLIYPNPVAQIAKAGNCEPQTICKGEIFNLIDSSQVGSLGAPISSWSWDIDADGSVDYTTQNPSISINDTGATEIKLIVQTNFGCTDSLSLTFNVIEPPVSDFSFDTTAQCGPVTVNLLNNSFGRIDSTQWQVFTLDPVGNRQIMVTDTNRFINSSITLLPSYIADTTYYFELIVNNCCGSDTLLRSLTLKPQPVAAMLASTTNGCTPLPVNFQLDGLVRGEPDYLVMNFGDGRVDTLFQGYTIDLNGDTIWTWGQQSHVFINPLNRDTTYTVSLSAFNDCGDSTVTLDILVHPNTVQAFFQADPSTGCEDLLVDFTDFSFGGTNISWCFDFDTTSMICNQPVATGRNFTHTFSQPGTYVVAQFVNDGCSYDTAYQTITVYPSPQAAFTNTTNICEGDSVFFNSQSLSNGSSISSYLWILGDGDSSRLTNPVHVYDTSGTFNVKLIIGSANGCKDSVLQPITIYDKPNVDFSFSDVCFNDQPIQFFDSSMVSSGQIVSTLWDFGDGNTATSINPSHNYQSPGLYRVSLVKISSNGCVDSAFKNINVFPEATAGFSYQRLGDDSCSVPQTIAFFNQSVNAQGFTWDFDYANNPGQFTSTLNNPTHTYGSFGVYQVALFVSNQFGCRDTLIKTVVISPVPNAGFAVDTFSGCMPLTVNFTDTSKYNFSGPGMITQWIWDFDDGSSSSQSNPTHTYNSPGTYMPQLIIITDAGCSDTVLGKEVEVYPKPIPDFDIQLINATEVQLVNTSSGIDSSSRYSWSLGDGTASSRRSPRHRYQYDLSRGEQDLLICLEIENGFGCRDSICKNLKLRSLQLNVPNAFAPELQVGSEANVFLPKGHSLKTYTLRIYDKWGNIVFESKALDEDGVPIEAWDGTHYLNGSPLPMGSYTWRIDATFNDGTVWFGKKYKNGNRLNVGSVTLIR